MKCALVFLSVLALGCALPLLQEASIHIAVAADGTISIYGTSGNKLVISKVWQNSGKNNVEVLTGVEHGTVKKILLSQETTLEYKYQTGLTEADVLVEIFKNYQGDVDMYTYAHLLKQVYVQVYSGHVRMAVYNILKNFIAQEVSWKKFVSTEVSMADYVSPKWYSLYNYLGLKNTGLGYTQEDFSNFNRLRSDYYSIEPRNYVEQPEYLKQMIPEQYYGDYVDAIPERKVQIASYEPIQYQQGYMWQQPIYQKMQQTKWVPQQFNGYTNKFNVGYWY